MSSERILSPRAPPLSGRRRIAIPAITSSWAALDAGNALQLERSAGLAAWEMVIEGFALRLVRAVAGPQLVRRGERLVVRPRATEGQRTEIDVARLIEEERDRWPA